MGGGRPSHKANVARVTSAPGGERPGPLDGVRVIELSRHLAGPWAAMTLGDLGADVIKVERPGAGDDSRDWGPIVDGESAYFASANRNKRSVTIDLTTPAGLRSLESLLRTADVVIDNFRPGTMDRLGLGDSMLEAWNPRLVRCSISAFGAQGIGRDRAGMDLLLQAASGLMSITGEDGRPPVRVGVSLVDLIAGANAAQAVLAALFERERSGLGQRIEIALMDGVLAWLSYHVTGSLMTGQTPGRLGASHASVAPYGAYATREGWLIIAAGTDPQFRTLCEVLGLRGLLDDPRFIRNSDRCRNRDALDARIAAALADDSAEAWAAVLGPQGVACSPVRTITEALTDPAVVERDLVAWLEPHEADRPRMPVVAPAMRFSRTPAAIRRVPPRLGEHTAEVLGPGGSHVDGPASAEDV
jgi:crotonobetainyl-CoA:carnitine CoA-transferase CaiB-like acyl-CoA transferase